MKVFVEGFSGVGPIWLEVENGVGKEALNEHVMTRVPDCVRGCAYLTRQGGRQIEDGTFSDDILNLQLNVRLPGGKGGFGSMLRAQGGKMRRKKGKKNEEQSDSFRNLDGRRLKTVRQAKELAKYLEKQPEMQRKANEKKRGKLQSIIDAAENDKSAKTKFADTEFLEQCEDLVQGVKETVDQSTASSSSSSNKNDNDTASTSSSTSQNTKQPKGFNFFDDEESD
ncbi:hypothetical protein TRICI_003395 [Trichomonascus ciferrii]|uniref:SDE2-like domain-containing protein n=1 Tax=Trichomonascus ciferrii TaxID=44093 RepID=A0A642V400_9ASCO|nr:hypothetical protein TRICI_003395 [Trichomonascus ciferrii]